MRLGHVHVGGTLDEVRRSFAGTHEGADDYLLIRYGAVLRPWVVQQGAIVEGIDLHPYLRTGDERRDRTLARVIEFREARGGRWHAIGRVLEPYTFEAAPALPLLTRVLELQDRIEAGAADTDAQAELDRILEAAEAGQAPVSYDGTAVEGLHLDWDALAKALPPLREPVLGTDWVSVHRADPGLRHPRATWTPAPTPPSRSPCTSG